MRGTLIVTNDFPPRQGGIQSFVHALALRLPAGQVVVYAPAWEGAAEFDQRQPFPVLRHPTSLMLPVPSVRRRAVAALTEHGCDTVLFGAAAPLGLLAPALRRAGARRIVALTHGHEAGWAALPGARGLLRRIGDHVDVVTYLGEYFRVRLARALSPAAAARMVRLAPGVDTAAFRPGAGGARIRDRLGLAGRPVVVCVSRLVRRKGQDTLIRAWPLVCAPRARRAPAARRQRPGPGGLRRWPAQLGVAGSVVFTGQVPGANCRPTTTPGTCSRCPAGPGGRGLDVEGLGIVYLEASATGLPVIAGDSGGAPDAVLDRRDRLRGPGPRRGGPGRPAHRAARRPGRGAAMGDKGLAWVDRSGAGTWSRSGWSGSWPANRPPPARTVPGPATGTGRTSGESGVQRVDVGGEILGDHARRTLSDGVRWPSCSVKSTGATRNRRIDSARDTALFASSTAGWISAIRSGSSRRSAAVASAGLRVLLLPGVERLPRRGSPGGHVRPAVADHHALADQRSARGAGPPARRGATFLPPAVTISLLLPAGHPQVALVVEFAEVAGVQPAVGGQGLRGAALVAPVAA